MTISDFIRDLGGSAHVAARVGKSADAVRQWVFKNRLPRSAWPELIDAYPNVSMDQLKELEAGTRPTAPAS